jgi:hypothetical protein
MGVLDRLGKVVKAEWNHRVARRSKDDAAAGAHDDDRGRSRGPQVEARVPERKPAVVDVDGALRVLELSGSPSLVEVRAQYRELARRYHPKTQSANADEAHAARVVLEALTDALEILEQHLLPLHAA